MFKCSSKLLASIGFRALALLVLLVLYVLFPLTEVLALEKTLFWLYMLMLVVLEAVLLSKLDTPLIQFGLKVITVVITLLSACILSSESRYCYSFAICCGAIVALIVNLYSDCLKWFKNDRT